MIVHAFEDQELINPAMQPWYERWQNEVEREKKKEKEKEEKEEEKEEEKVEEEDLQPWFESWQKEVEREKEEEEEDLQEKRWVPTMLFAPRLVSMKLERLWEKALLPRSSMQNMLILVQVLPSRSSTRKKFSNTRWWNRYACIYASHMLVPLSISPHPPSLCALGSLTLMHINGEKHTCQAYVYKALLSSVPCIWEKDWSLSLIPWSGTLSLFENQKFEAVKSGTLYLRESLLSLSLSNSMKFYAFYVWKPEIQTSKNLLRQPLLQCFCIQSFQ